MKLAVYKPVNTYFSLSKSFVSPGQVNWNDRKSVGSNNFVPHGTRVPVKANYGTFSIFHRKKRFFACI